MCFNIQTIRMNSSHGLVGKYDFVIVRLCTATLQANEIYEAR